MLKGIFNKYQNHLSGSLIYVKNKRKIKKRISEVAIEKNNPLHKIRSPSHA